LGIDRDGGRPCFVVPGWLRREGRGRRVVGIPMVGQNRRAVPRPEARQPTFLLRARLEARGRITLVPSRPTHHAHARGGIQPRSGRTARPARRAPIVGVLVVEPEVRRGERARPAKQEHDAPPVMESGIRRRLTECAETGSGEEDEAPKRVRIRAGPFHSMWSCASVLKPSGLIYPRSLRVKGGRAGCVP